MRRDTIFSAVLAGLCLLGFSLSGCRPKTKTGAAQPAEKVKGHLKDVHSQGPHGGQTFHFAEGHDVLAEIVFKKDPRRIELYFLEHDDKTKGVPASDKQITLTGLKHEGKSLPDVVLTAAPLAGEKDGASRFVASGMAVPAEVDEAHALNGATFTATIGGKKRSATINIHEHGHDEDDDHHHGHDEDGKKHHDHGKKGDHDHGKEGGNS